MTLSGKELTAILKSGIAIVAADGINTKEEMAMLVQNLVKFGCTLDEAQGFTLLAASMDVNDMISTLKGLSVENKKYVCGYWAAISACDGDVAKEEVKVWQLLCTLAGFPSMTFAESLKFWVEH